MCQGQETHEKEGKKAVKLPNSQSAGKNFCTSLQENNFPSYDVCLFVCFRVCVWSSSSSNSHPHELFNTPLDLLSQAPNELFNPPTPPNSLSVCVCERVVLHIYICVSVVCVLQARYDFIVHKWEWFWWEKCISTRDSRAEQIPNNHDVIILGKTVIVEFYSHNPLPDWFSLSLVGVEIWYFKLERRL